MAKAPEVRAQATVKAQQLTGAAQQKAQEKPGAAVGVVLAVLGLLILRGRRRRRRMSASSDLAELRRDIDEIRGELADTVNALVANTAEVKRQAQELRAQQLRAQATNKFTRPRRSSSNARSTRGSSPSCSSTRTAAWNGLS